MVSRTKTLSLRSTEEVDASLQLSIACVLFGVVYLLTEVVRVSEAIRSSLLKGVRVSALEHMWDTSAAVAFQPLWHFIWKLHGVATERIHV